MRAGTSAAARKPTVARARPMRATWWRRAPAHRPAVASPATAVSRSVPVTSQLAARTSRPIAACVAVIMYGDRFTAR
ncbi:hypothetical protein ACFPRL_12365 [Pseudoclavibacter helvolus]